MSTTITTTRSADGTEIAVEWVGAGPALVLVDCAGHFRGFSSFDGLVERLAPSFSTYQYDRRGRGDSTDTAPYAVAREVEDLAAVIEVAGGTAFVHAFSSGALLALHAAAAGVSIERLSVLEPPLSGDEDRAEQAAFTAALRDRLEAGDRDGALDHFLTAVVPAEIVDGMRESDAWSAMASVAPTLVYDCIVSEAMSPDVLARVDVPTLVLESAGSTDDLTGMAAAVAATMTSASHRSLPGSWHGVDDDALATALTEFFLA